ncbi:MAG TPA: DUF559 domain-containing protein [Anaerolineaceae bacterium]
MAEGKLGPNPPAPFPDPGESTRDAPRGKGEKAVAAWKRESLITQQKISGEKLQLAKEFRRKMTPEEALLWVRLRGNKLGGLHFRRQQIVYGFIVDFYCHSAALVIELDGEFHNNQIIEDEARDRIMRDHGLRILRFPNYLVRTDISIVLNQILSNASTPPSLAKRPGCSSREQGRGPGS